MQLDANGTNTVVSVDVNGGGDNYVQVATLNGIATAGQQIVIIYDDGTDTVPTI